MNFNLPLYTTILFFLLGGNCLSDDSLDIEFRDLITKNIITRHFADTIKGLFSDFINNMKCDICLKLTPVLREYSEQKLRKPLFIICSFINLQGISPDMCKSLVTLNFPHIYYILTEKPTLAASEICGIFWNADKCIASQEWNITIERDQTINRTKGIYKGKTLKVLHLTDIHYDPLYAPGRLAECKKPICCQDDSGKVQREIQMSGNWADSRHCDIPLYTVTDSLKHISKMHTDIDYVYFTGDIISHRLWDTSEKNNTRDIRLIMDEIKKYFNVPIFSILGNHEAHPCNVFTPLDLDDKRFSMNWLYKEANDIWPELMGNYSESTIEKGGYYTYLVKPGFRIIGLNSNVAYIWNWWLIYDPVDPYGQLKWMNQILQEAEANNEYVHILSHSPSSHKETDRRWSREFRRIIERYSNTIVAIFNGHTHTDEFILYHKKEDSTKPVAVAWNGGSLTPFSHNNVNYRIYTIDSENYEVTDYDQYIFNVSDASKSTSSPHWYKLYSFKDEYKLKDLTPESLKSLVEEMVRNEHLADTYMRHRIKDMPESDGVSKKEAICSILKSEVNDDSICKQLLQ